VAAAFSVLLFEGVGLLHAATGMAALLGGGDGDDGLWAGRVVRPFVFDGVTLHGAFTLEGTGGAGATVHNRPGTALLVDEAVDRFVAVRAAGNQSGGLVDNDIVRAEGVDIAVGATIGARADQITALRSRRDIASAAGVSIATVSLSLRNHPRISSATRERVRACAAELGYQPHPLVGALMHQLRGGRQGPARLVLLGDPDPRHQERLLTERRWRRGAEKQAAALGFSLLPQALGRDPDSDATLPARWLQQGIRGVVIAPLAQATDLSHLDFSELAVVSSSHILKAPAVHRIAADAAWSAVTACDALW
jgi:hypothetical protein